MVSLWLLLEDESKLKSWALAHGNPVEQALAQLDIVPLFRGKGQMSELGRGIANVALEVVYKGKRAVARYSSNLKELESLIKFQSFKGKLPAKYAKHFPKIYDTFRLDLPEETLHGAVVEMLAPLPPGLKFDLESTSYIDKIRGSRVHMLLANPDIVADLAAEAATTSEDEQALVTIFEDQLADEVKHFANKTVEQADDTITALCDRIADKNERMGYDIRMFGANIMKFLRGTAIPYDKSSDDRSTSAAARKHPSAKVREFYEFLEALSKVGMDWGDLHADNFMVRPETGDFVVVDPGFFSAKR